MRSAGLGGQSQGVAGLDDHRHLEGPYLRADPRLHLDFCEEGRSCRQEDSRGSDHDASGYRAALGQSAGRALLGSLERPQFEQADVPSRGRVELYVVGLCPVAQVVYLHGCVGDLEGVDLYLRRGECDLRLRQYRDVEVYLQLGLHVEVLVSGGDGHRVGAGIGGCRVDEGQVHRG